MDEEARRSVERVVTGRLLKVWTDRDADPGVEMFTSKARAVVCGM
jgi:hypothetical protein